MDLKSLATKYDMATKTFQLSEIFQFLPKSHRKAGDGLESGLYPFFTSSQLQTKWLNEADYSAEALILGTGGAPSIHCANNFSTSADTFIIAPKDKNLLAKYVYYFLSGNKDILDRGFKGAGLRHLSKEYAEKIQIPFPIDKNGSPDLAEQKRIVAMLEETETLKNKRTEADQKMDKLIPALFSKMFSGSKFDDPKLGTSITNLTSGARGWAKYYTSTPGYKYIRIQNVKNAKLNFEDVQHVEVSDSAESKRIKVQEGDLLISITADLGRTAVVDKETATEGAYINQHIASVRLNDEYNPLFVAHYLENGGKSQFLKYGQAASKKGLNFDSIRSLRVPKPPIKLQNDFVEKVKEIEAQKERQKQSAIQLKVLFSSLLSRSFSRGSIKN